MKASLHWQYFGRKFSFQFLQFTEREIS